MSEPKLSLLARKNIKEKEEKVTSDKERITKAAEITAEVTLDPEYNALAAFFDTNGYKDRVGDVTQWYTDALASMLEKDYKEETAKAALQANWTTGVIRMRLGTNKKGESKYNTLDIENGDLILTIFKNGNVGSGMTDLIEKLTDAATGLSVKASQNVKQNEEKRTEGLQAIHDTVQLSADVTLDVDWPEFAKKVDTEGYKDRVGDCIQWFIDGAKSNIESKFKNSDIARNALQTAWTTGVLKVEIGTLKKGESKYNETLARDGDLVIIVYKLGNASSVGGDLVDKLTCPNTNLTLKNALNVHENEEKRNNTLQAIHDVTQHTADVTLDIDWPTFTVKSDAENYKDRAGDVVQWFLDGVKSSFEKHFKNSELSRTALNTAWTTGVLKVEIGVLKKGESKYNETLVRDNDLVVIVYKLGNASSTGDDILSKLTDPASNLPLKSALNMQEKEEKKDENLKKMQDAVGLSNDVTLDVDWAVLEPLIAKLGYANRCGDVVYEWIIGGLTSNIEKICKEELTKEALAEIWTTGVIRMEDNPKVQYHACEFTNGDLIIQYKNDRLCSNCSSIGQDIEKKL